MPERFRFFKRTHKTVTRSVGYTNTIEDEIMETSKLGIQTNSEMIVSPISPIIYVDGDDADVIDPAELERVTRIEKSIEAKVQKVTKLAKVSMRKKGTDDLGKTKVESPQRNYKTKTISIPAASTLTTPTGVLGFEGLHDSISVEYDGDQNNINYDENGQVKQDEDEMVFVTVPKDSLSGLNLPCQKRYYDNNEQEEEYWIHLR